MLKKIVSFYAVRALVLLAFIGLSACATSVLEEDRDRNSSYRGFWAANVLKTQSQFSFGGSTINCWDMSSFGNVQIAGGRVVARVRGYDLAGFVNSSGIFTAAIELDKDPTLGAIKYALEGQLDDAAGTGTAELTLSIQRVAGKGCKSQVSLVKSKI